MYKGALAILQGLLVESIDTSASNPSSSSSTSLVLLQAVDQTFTDRMTDFLKYFVLFHLKRCEDNNFFPLLEFLRLMFKYSFMQPSIVGFSACLDIWDTVVDYIQVDLLTDKHTYTREQPHTLLTLLFREWVRAENSLFFLSFFIIAYFEILSLNSIILSVSYC